MNNWVNNGCPMDGNGNPLHQMRSKFAAPGFFDGTREQQELIRVPFEHVTEYIHKLQTNKSKDYMGSDDRKASTAANKGMPKHFMEALVRAVSEDYYTSLKPVVRHGGNNKGTLGVHQALFAAPDNQHVSADSLDLLQAVKNAIEGLSIESRHGLAFVHCLSANSNLATKLKHLHRELPEYVVNVLLPTLLVQKIDPPRARGYEWKPVKAVDTFEFAGILNSARLVANREVPMVALGAPKRAEEEIWQCPADHNASGTPSRLGLNATDRANMPQFAQDRCKQHEEVIDAAILEAVKRIVCDLGELTVLSSMERYRASGNVQTLDRAHKQEPFTKPKRSLRKPKRSLTIPHRNLTIPNVSFGTGELLDLSPLQPHRWNDARGVELGHRCWGVELGHRCWEAESAFAGADDARGRPGARRRPCVPTSRHGHGHAEREEREARFSSRIFLRAAE